MSVLSVENSHRHRHRYRYRYRYRYRTEALVGRADAGNERAAGESAEEDHEESRNAKSRNMNILDFLGLSALQMETLTVLCIIAACSAAYCFIVGEITRNNSQMDKLWSILPAVYAWVVACKGGLDARLVVMLTTLPAVAAMETSNQFGGWPDLVAAVLMMGFIAYEAVADIQQWRFQSTKWNIIHSGKKLEELPYPYNLGFNTSGLWRYSRHPNYLGEQSVWVSFYLFSIAAGAGILNWSICGAVLLILLFLGSSTLGEYISKSKYPEYGNYVKTVNRFFPGRPYGKSKN